MRKQSNLSLICSLVCAAGSLWFALAELFDREDSVPRRVVRVFLWLAACAVWTANLVVDLWERKAGTVTETDYMEQIEIEEDNFND